MCVCELKKVFDESVKACPIVAILRGIKIEEVPEVCAILADNKINLLEIPLNTPNALQCIAEAVKCAAPGQLVGAGTVLTPADAEAVHAAGGKFIISPNTDSSVIIKTKELGMLSIPGCFTATECFTAQAAGADYIKLFPAGSIGANYIKDLQAVIKLPFMAVGGVNAQNMAEFLKVCSGVGIGSAIYKPGKNMSDIRRDTEVLTSIVKNI